MRSRARAYGPLALLALLLQAAAAGAQPPAAEELATLGEEAAWLAHRVELAEGEQFHLLLDPDAGTLVLALGGVGLLRMPVTVDAVAPRVLFRSRPTPPGWRDEIWRGGELDPPWPTPSVELSAADALAEPVDPSAAAAPPTVEELVPVPDRYRVRFDGGLAVEVSAPPVARAPWWSTAAAAVRQRVEDAWVLARDGDADRLRLRLTVTPEDAARLYRSLPPEVSLVIAPHRAAS